MVASGQVFAECVEVHFRLEDVLPTEGIAEAAAVDQISRWTWVVFLSVLVCFEFVSERAQSFLCDFHP